MSNIFFHIITLIFGACCAFITLHFKMFGWMSINNFVFIK